ncbi:lecithin retinol acyltransferase family protein [Methylomagnum ishizawai]
MPLGSHLVTPRTGYSHHGIYVGGGRVVHYSGLADGVTAGPVEEVSLAEFTCGKGYDFKRHAGAMYIGEAVVERARSRIGEECYAVFSNNCEHFCEWCINGDHQSDQIDNGTVATGLSGAALAGNIAKGVVAASGSAVGLSGAGIMSGLATAGGVVGGGAVAGIGVLGAGPGLAMASLVNNTVLKDNPALDQDERDSRAVGRKATYAGAAAGTVGSIAAVSAMGTTAGLSGAGIASGLAAIGGTVGGGMAAGVVVATAAPVAAAAAVGYGLYKAVKWFKK